MSTKRELRFTNLFGTDTGSPLNVYAQCTDHRLCCDGVTDVSSIRFPSLVMFEF